MEQLRLVQLQEACAVQTAALFAASEQLRGKRQEAAAPLIPKREVALAAQTALRQELEEIRCLTCTEHAQDVTDLEKFSAVGIIIP